MVAGCGRSFTQAPMALSYDGRPFDGFGRRKSMLGAASKIVGALELGFLLGQFFLASRPVSSPGSYFRLSSPSSPKPVPHFA